MEVTEQNSRFVAMMIEAIKKAYQSCDELFEGELDEYLKACEENFNSTSNRYDSMAPLIRSYDPYKGQLYQEQANAISHLREFISSLKKCDELKAKIASNKSSFDQIERMFL